MYKKTWWTNLNVPRLHSIWSTFHRLHSIWSIYKQGGGSGDVWCYKLRSEVRFHIEDNYSSSFAGETVVAEKNVTWETNFLDFGFVT